MRGALGQDPGEIGEAVLDIEVEQSLCAEPGETTGVEVVLPLCVSWRTPARGRSSGN